MPLRLYSLIFLNCIAAFFLSDFYVQRSHKNEQKIEQEIFYF